MTESEADRVRRFEGCRAVLRPAGCKRGIRCWVESGPAAMLGNEKCAGCGNRPNLVGNEHAHAKLLCATIIEIEGAA